MYVHVISSLWKDMRDNATLKQKFQSYESVRISLIACNLA